VKILNVLDISIPITIGYTTRARYLVNSLKKMDLDPAVITSFRQEEAENCFVKTQELPEESHNDISYYRSVTFGINSIRIAKNIPFLRELCEIIAFARNITVIVRRIKPDILHAHSPILVGFAALRAAKKNNLPIVYEIRAFWEDAAVDQGKMKEGAFRYRLIRYLETRLLKKVDAVSVICEGLKKDILDRGILEEKVFVIPNGVDTERFFPLPKDQTLLKTLSLVGKKVVGFIGSLFNFEGVELLVEAMKILRDQDDIICLIIGYGQSEERIKALIKQYRLERKVIFLGKVSHEVVESYYSIIDIFVYPRISLRITELVTPLKPLEAMAMEKVVIGSDVGGLKELINDGEDGLLFQKGNVQDLVEKLRYVLENQNIADKLGKTARQNMKSFRNWNKTTEMYPQVYNYAKSQC